MQRQHPLAKRAVVAASAIAALLVSAVTASPALAAPAVPEDPADKFTAEAQEALAGGATADFWVRFADRADLSGASSISDWGQRGVAVHDALKSTADASQADVVKALDAAGVDYQAHWISNAVLVRDGSLDLATQLAADMGVSEIRQTESLPLEEPVEKSPADSGAGMGLHAVEWGVQAINADDVWAQGITGQGITVSNIDSGVDGDHPALASKYRGLQADGSIVNDYNWFDVSGACGDAPCDTDDHGSHTMGTMLGDDGAGNQIGVAPGANWIAANGCDTCSDADLIASGEWILAPTTVAGTNADPTKRPHIVNNSWGTRTPSTSPFMEDVLIAWEAAGIFSSWSNGNNGPSCTTSGSPGSRTVNYSVGSYNQAGNISSYSSRGPGQDGEIKPNISAPGENVRSAYSDGTYGNMSGTSMAAPHLAGAVALLWSAAPSLVGDIEGTRALLNETAVDVDDTTCGGTAEDNNVWGEGKLDVAALIAAAPVGDAGELTGTVVDAEGDAVSGATVAVEGPTTRTLTTDAAGAFTVGVVAGDYSITVSAFGYATTTVSATVDAGATTEVPVTLEAATSFPVSGTVTDAASGAAVANATVGLSGPIEAATTDASGAFSFAEVPAGTYTLSATAGACAAPYSTELVVDGPESVDVALDALQDAFGYSCAVGTDGYREGSDLVSITGDEAKAEVALPFDFQLYGEFYDTAYISSNGHVNFLAGVTVYSNKAIPSSTAPNAVIYPFWDDLKLDANSAVYTDETTVDGQDAFVIEWRNAHIFGDETARLSFSVTLVANGAIILGYGDQAGDSDRLTGSSATIGLEDAAGAVASQYSFNEAVVTPGLAITYSLPPAGRVTGAITDVNDTLPIEGATITATPTAGGEAAETTTAADGSYALRLLVGDYTVTASADGYKSKSKAISFTEDGQTAKFNSKLKTGIASIDVESFEWIVGEGEQRQAELKVTNSGTAPLQLEIGEIARAANADTPTPALSQAAAKERADGGFQSSRMSLTAAEAELAELEAATEAADTNARTAEALYTDAQRKELSKRSIAPDAEGDVLASWATGLSVPWGVGFDGDVWISDPEEITNTRFSTAGEQLASFSSNWGGTWAGDLAQDTRTGDMCQINVGGDNAIHCFDQETGEETSVISGSGWTAVSQRGLAYNPADDVFYTGGWNEGVIYTVAGSTHGTPGELLTQCSPSNSKIAGLGYNPTSGTLWMVDSAASTTLTQLTPGDCATVRTVAFPNQGEYPGGGLEVDASGALWATDQLTGEAYLIDVGDPQETDVPWLSAEPASVKVPVGATKTITVNIDATGIDPGVYGANLVIATGAGRVSQLSVPVSLVVSAYQVGVNAGGGAYTAGDLFEWSADQAWSDGAWGWIGQRSDAEAKDVAIGGTTDDTLYQTRRTGSFSYVFDDVPAGTYTVDLGFAEFQKTPKERDRVFDVLVNGTYQLIEEDVAAEVGGRYADKHQLVIEHDGGDLTVQFKERRSYDYPIINALKLQERGDL
ncbi:carboxypeptidase regulatory-like domain-containing protein [Agromyces archimandritae]|uniref:Carboxypeptidase regulatory-like domain-containing protein n=1 Tax=Agromyces archimandritae TaxID=2781962 RepID=A0A975FK78_9MICO|nr:carboxypeptidase regulatory-like domain-containing protein [Agromyces archimandritae]QTX03594.1 carboxypeptidase regulatory-like domain-containing protein [Agromyces archimandritae]